MVEWVGLISITFLSSYLSIFLLYGFKTHTILLKEIIMLLFYFDWLISVHKYKTI